MLKLVKYTERVGYKLYAYDTYKVGQVTKLPNLISLIINYKIINTKI